MGILKFKLCLFSRVILQLFAKYPKVYSTHLTMGFGVPDPGSEIKGYRLGLVYKLCWNERIQAAKIWGPTTTNRIPHISISSLVLVAPVESNTMLAGEHSSKLVVIPVIGKVVWEQFAEIIYEI